MTAAKPPVFYAPDGRFLAVRDEVIFGSGSYTLAVPAKRARALFDEWQSFLARHPLGPLFRMAWGSNYRTTIRIRQSPEFATTVERAGYTIETLTLPRSDGAQKQVLRQLAAVLADSHLNLKEPG